MSDAMTGAPPERIAIKLSASRYTPRAIQPKQLRRVHATWHEWAGKLKLPSEKERELRHYYVWLLSEGRAKETVALRESDAERVIGVLARLVRAQRLSTGAAARAMRIAGTAGRHGFPESRAVPPGKLAWNALWACADALRMDRAALDSFIQRHYIKARLRSVDDIVTMSDLNRVLWGLKAVLRRRNNNGKERQPRLLNAA